MPGQPSVAGDMVTFLTQNVTQGADDLAVIPPASSAVFEVSPAPRQQPVDINEPSGRT
jgi:hypothetical protein